MGTQAHRRTCDQVKDVASLHLRRACLLLLLLLLVLPLALTNTAASFTASQLRTILGQDGKAVRPNWSRDEALGVDSCRCPWVLRMTPMIFGCLHYEWLMSPSLKRRPLFDSPQRIIGRKFWQLEMHRCRGQEEQRGERKICSVPNRRQPLFLFLWGRKYMQI